MLYDSNCNTISCAYCYLVYSYIHVCVGGCVCGGVYVYVYMYGNVKVLVLDQKVLGTWHVFSSTIY